MNLNALEGGCEIAAYFTPALEEIPTLSARVMFAGPDDRPQVEFLVAVDPGARIEQMVEVRFMPVTTVEAVQDGFTIEGVVAGDGRTGRLRLDASGEPVRAVFNFLLAR